MAGPKPFVAFLLCIAHFEQAALFGAGPLMGAFHRRPPKTIESLDESYIKSSCPCAEKWEVELTATNNLWCGTEDNIEVQLFMEADEQTCQEMQQVSKYIPHVNAPFLCKFHGGKNHRPFLFGTSGSRVAKGKGEGKKLEVGKVGVEGEEGSGEEEAGLSHTSSVCLEPEEMLRTTGARVPHISLIHFKPYSSNTVNKAYWDDRWCFKSLEIYAPGGCGGDTCSPKKKVSTFEDGKNEFMPPYSVGIFTRKSDGQQTYTADKWASSPIPGCQKEKN